jgi:hypothetical protein
MKIRIQGNSLRIRLGRSELAQFLHEGRIEDTVQFTPAPEAKLTYALEVSPAGTTQTQVRYSPQEVAVVLAPRQVVQWSLETEVGVYAQVPVGTGDALEVIVEKDFACLDRSDEANKDTFANPHIGTNCQVD